MRFMDLDKERAEVKVAFHGVGPGDRRGEGSSIHLGAAALRGVNHGFPEGIQVPFRFREAGPARVEP